MYVPYVLALKARLLDGFHITVAHPDHEGTYSVILRPFYRLKLRKDVKSFVQLCSKWQRIKPRTDKPYGSSIPLPVDLGILFQWISLPSFLMLVDMKQF